MPRPCTICRSRRWHKDASGVVMCEEGHVLQSYIPESTERTELGPHAMRKRTLKTTRGRAEDGGRAEVDDGVYHGARARFLYFECLQLILRKQVAVLRKEWGLPDKFEVICRDVWALHLSSLPRPPVSEEEVHAGRGDDGGDDAKSSSDSSSDSGSASSASSQDTLLAKLMQEASESGSSSESDDGAGRRGKNRERERRRTSGRNRYEKPVGNVAVLMVACWVMRVPAMYADIIRMIETYRLPYLEGVRELPGGMRRHLGKATVSMLSPRFAPGVLTVHRMAARLARLFRSEYGIEFGEANAAPMLWRAVRGMQGTTVLYAMAKRLARTVDVRLRLEGRGEKKRDNVPAELALMGAVIVVLKLVYGLDGAERHVTGNDPGCAMPRLGDYLASLEREEDDVEFDFRELVRPMEDGVLDTYFPLGDAAGDGDDDVRVIRERSPLNLVESAPHSPILPASVHAIYHSLDYLGHLPNQYATVLAAASSFLHLHPSLIAAQVENYERRLVRLSKKI